MKILLKNKFLKINSEKFVRMFISNPCKVFIYFLIAISYFFGKTLV